MAIETSTLDDNSSQNAIEVIPLNELARHANSQDENDLDNQEYDVPPHCESPIWDFAFPILSIIIYILHLLVDLVLAAEYLREKNYLYCGLSISFAFLPVLLVNLFLAFFNNREKNISQKCIGLLQFAPLGDFVRCFNFLKKSMEFKDNIESVDYKKNYYRMFNSRANALKADALETALKLSTQGMLQFFVAIQEINLDELNKIGVLQITSIILSLLHLFWILGCISLEQKIFWAVLGVILYFADIGSDLLLFAEYLLEEQYLFAFLTLSFVLVASIMITYDSDRRERELPMNSFKNVLICVPIVMFNLEPVITAIKSIYFRLKITRNYENSSECEHYNEERRLNKVMAVELKFSETILEAAPQLTLQVSILLSSTLKGYEFNFRVVVQLFSIVTSFIGFGVGTLSNYNAMLVVYERDKMSKLGTVLMFLWYFPVIVSRILTVGMMASISPLWVMVILIGVHWIISFLYWLYKLRWKAVLERIISSFWNSITHIFIPDPTDIKTIIAVISSILGIENFCLVFYVIFFASFDDLSISESYKSNIRTFYYILSAIIVFTGVLGNIFMILFVFILKLHVSFDELENNSISNA